MLMHVDEKTMDQADGLRRMSRSAGKGNSRDWRKGRHWQDQCLREPGDCAGAEKQERDVDGCRLRACQCGCVAGAQ